MKVVCLVAFTIVFCSCAPRWNDTIGCKLVIKYPAEYSLQPAAKSKLVFKDQLTAFYESPQIFIINTQQDTIITGTQGTKIEIHAYCLTDENGNAVEGLAKVELKEVYSKKDLILFNKPTMSDGKLLETNGQIYLNATMNGKKLSIGCSEGLQVTLITPQISDMVMWTGEINSKGDLNWIRDTTIVVLPNESSFDGGNEWAMEGEGNEVFWYNSTVDNFLFTTPKFGWINCDRFYEDDRAKVNMYVKLKNPFPKEYRTYVYALFTNINSVMQLSSEDGENYKLSNVPEGESIKFISVSETEIKTFFSMKESIVMGNQKEVMELLPMAKNEIKKTLENL